MHGIRNVVMLSALCLLAACASSALVTGRTRPPIEPSQVQVYQMPPQGGFEEIAQLEVQSGALTYGEQNKLNSVLAKLRKQAALLGANGVLLVGTEDDRGGGGGVSIGAGGGSFGRHSYSGGGVGVNISPTRKRAHAIAIYVPGTPGS